MVSVPSTAISSPKTGQKQMLRWLGPGTWGLADQSLISATNFVTMVLLARGLGPAAFGMFVLVYTAMLFCNSLQSALVLQPHNVLGATKEGRDYVDYTSSSALTQAVFCLVLAGSAAAIAVVSTYFSTVSALLWALVPTMVAWQFQEFTRRVLYTEGRIAAAFVNDLVSYGGQTGAIACLWWTDLLTGPVALLAIGGTSGLAAGIGFGQIRRSMFGKIDRSVFHENWRFGRWLAGGEIGYWLSSQIYLYLTGYMLGPAAAGIMKAGYVLFGPARIIGFFLRTALPTWFSKTLAADGKRALNQQLKWVYGSTLPVLGAYCLLMAVIAAPVLRLLYGAEYAGHELVVVLYAVYAMIAFLASIVSAALRAQRHTFHIFVTQMGAMLTLPVGWWFIRILGIPGAVLGMIVTASFLNVALWWGYRQALQAEDAS